MMHGFARYFRIAALTLAAFLLGAPTASAQPPQWHFYVTKINGIHHAFVEQKATSLGKHCSARLEFWAAPSLGMEGEGSLALEFTFSPVHPCSFQGFNFDHFDYETDGFVDSNQQLISAIIRVTVFRGGKRFVHSIGVAFINLDNNDEDPTVATGVTFIAYYSIDNKHSPIRKLVDQLIKGADRMEIAVIEIEGKNHTTIFSATFPLAGSRVVLAKMLKGL